VTETTIDVETTGKTRVAKGTNMLAIAMKSSGDGPPCSVCGTITVRNGTCHKCVNCGNSMGCS
jgi:ribonucleoside-diphosphate reductase alpha chain